MASRGGRISPRHLRKRKYNLACVEDEVSVHNILSEELDIVSSDELSSESEGECLSDESSNTSTESEGESETSVCTDGWEDVMVRDKKPKAYTFSKNAGLQFHLLPDDAEPMDYFSLFFSDELLNNVVETNRYARQKISEHHLSPRSIWSRSDLSVPEMKAFLGLIINMGLMSLPDIKDYWSSEWITQIKFVGDVMSRDRFQHIFWMMHVGNDTTEESSRAIKRTKKVHGVIEYIEKQFQKYFVPGNIFCFFTLCPSCTKFSSKPARSVALQGFKIPLATWLRQFFQTRLTRKG
jgi:hypothetical protein